jgi:type IX secretion system substrate protein
MSTNKITSLTITNPVGQTVYASDYNSEKVKVDVSSFPAGAYFIRINGSEMRKFVKQ